MTTLDESFEIEIPKGELFSQFGVSARVAVAKLSTEHPTWRMHQIGASAAYPLAFSTRQHGSWSHFQRFDDASPVGTTYLRAYAGDFTHR